MASSQEDDRSALLVGVYVRVSTAREEMISPELQRRDVDAYLARMSRESGRTWRAVIVVEDLDISGRSFAREGIQRLMAMVREGAITTIVTYRYDRFGRNVQQALAYVAEVESLGGQVVSATEPIDASTSMGNFMRTQTFAMAEMYSRQIGEGWKRVHQYRLAQGLPTNGRERYGYLAHRTTQQRSDGAWRMCPQGCAAGACTTGFVPDPETAPIVQWIYESYTGGMGFQAIAHALNAECTPCPGVVAASRSGNPARVERNANARWTAGGVIDVADSGFAAGLVSHKEKWLPGAHPPLISEVMWLAYRTRREAQRIVPTKARAAKWSLAGIAVCGTCGGPMYATSSPRGPQYALYCGSARVAGDCEGTYRTRAAVEAAVGLWLGTYANELEQATADALRAMPAQRRDPFKADKNRHQKTIAGAEGKLARLLDAYSDGVLDLAEYKRRRETVSAEVDVATRRLAQLDLPAAAAPSPETLRSFSETWPTLDPEARRDVAKALLKGVRVMPDKTVEIIPRWDAPRLVTFTHGNTRPQLVAP
jgi:DNA invertase Pin-like site-specific DNA recombinase